MCLAVYKDGMVLDGIASASDDDEVAREYAPYLSAMRIYAKSNPSKSTASAEKKSTDHTLEEVGKQFDVTPRCSRD